MPNGRRGLPREAYFVGDDQKQMHGCREHRDIREVKGNRLARELILESER